MLTFEQFIKSPQCKPLVLPDEEQPQDIGVWRHLEKEDRQKQYTNYCSQFEPEERVEANLNNVTKHIEKVLRYKSRAEYMRHYRKKPKFCPHCGKDIRT